MTTVGIRELKARLSTYVELARSGESIVVTDRGRPVAQLTPMGARGALEQLVEAGLATRPESRRPLPRPARTAGPVSDLIGGQRR